MASDLFDTDQRLVAGLVRQPRGPGQITNGVHARLARAAELIHHYMTVLHVDPSAFQPQVLDIADNARRHQHHVGLQGLIAVAFKAQLYRAPFHLAALQRTAGVQAYTVAGQGLGHMGTDLLILYRQDPIGHFNHADL
ncbi:hypothetical protein D3C79_790990 [compost metagenome]